jgi:hypothetical protein
MGSLHKVVVVVGVAVGAVAFGAVASAAVDGFGSGDGDEVVATADGPEAPTTT